MSLPPRATLRRRVAKPYQKALSDQTKAAQDGVRGVDPIGPAVQTALGDWGAGHDHTAVGLDRADAGHDRIAADPDHTDAGPAGAHAADWATVPGAPRHPPSGEKRQPQHQAIRKGFHSKQPLQAESQQAPRPQSWALRRESPPLLRPFGHAPCHHDRPQGSSSQKRAARLRVVWPPRSPSKPLSWPLRKRLPAEVQVRREGECRKVLDWSRVWKWMGC
jgi:hypothetical protein